MRARLVPGLGASLLWLGIALAPAVSQDAGSFAERIDVELVNVDVWVTDAKGNSVTGLAAADFEILHDDHPVAISHFTEAGVSAGDQRSATEKTGEGESAASTPAHVVVYFDQSRLHPRNYPALIESLEQFLAIEQVEPEQVLVLRQTQSLSVEAAFGSSRRQLEKALKGLGEGSASGIALETENEQALQAIRDSWEQSQDSVGSALSGLSAVPGAAEPGGGGAGTAGGPRGVVGGVGSGAGPDACGMFLNQVQPILVGYARSRAQRIGITLSNLADTASFLAGLPGVKTLLYLSDGLDLQPGTALASYASGLCPAGSADLLSGALSEHLTTSFLELTRHANANRVTFHSLQASGLLSPDVSSASAGRKPRGGGFRSRGLYESSQRTGERAGLSLIAEETGGRAIFNQNDLGPELARIGQDLRSYYSLAYQPPASKDSGAKGNREHRIEVRLSDASLSARYRRGYLEKDDKRWLAERIEGALNLGITSNPLGVRLGAGDIKPGEARPGGEATLRLPLYIMVPVERLAFLPQDGAQVAEITVQAMARSLASGAVATRQQTYRVKGSPGATGFANLVLELELGQGAQLTAVGIRDLASREASFVSTTLDLGPGG